MKINILSLVKGLSEMAVSAGTGVVVGNLVRATTPDDITKMQKVMVGIGAYAFGAVLGDLSAKYVSAQIDDYAGRIRDIFNPPVEDPDEISDEMLAKNEALLKNESLIAAFEEGFLKNESLIAAFEEQAKQADSKAKNKNNPASSNTLSYSGHVPEDVDPKESLEKKHNKAVKKALNSESE